MNIRQAQRTDIAIITDFQLKMAQETEELLLDRAVLQNGITAVFDDAGKGQYFVAEEQNQVVASLLITYEWSDWRNAVVWWIQSVYVCPEHRRKGVFRAMYQQLKEEVLRSGTICGLRLYVDQRNLSAQKVYQKMKMNGEHYRFFEWMKGDDEEF